MAGTSEASTLDALSDRHIALRRPFFAELTLQHSLLEAITGLSRYTLARQFRSALGTSPYRYLVMRRLDDARERIVGGCSLAEVACETGFADQAHFTRAFKAAFGLTPARYRALCTTRGRRG